MELSRRLAWIAGIALTCALFAVEGSAQTSGGFAPGSLAVEARDVRLAGDVVSGTLVNRSSHEARDLNVQVTRAWSWRDEKHPGTENPGGTYAFKFAGPIAPGASVAFRFELPKVDAPAELGSFTASAAVIGATEVDPAGAR